MLQAVFQATAIFAVTNVDDIILLTLYFGRAGGDHHGERSVVIGQYLGFGVILAVSVLAAVGLSLLPGNLVAYLGLVPLALGIRAAIIGWRARDAEGDERTPLPPLRVATVAGVTFANGGDNIAVYVPVLTALSGTHLVVYVMVFLGLVAIWCVASRYLATRSLIAKALTRWGHLLLPIVLITIGAVLLVEGGAFGL